MPTRRWGSEGLVNTILPGNQVDSDVAGLVGGGFVVVWCDTSSGDSAIRAQRYDAAGNRAGGELTIASLAGTDFIAPAVTALADGGFYVTATQLVGADNFIVGSVYDANGAVVRSQHPVFAVGLDNNSDVARLGTGSVVVWQDPDTTVGEINFRIFDAAGNGGAILTANAFGGGMQDFPAIAGAPGGDRFAVVWRTTEAAGGPRVRVFDAAGNPLSGDVRPAEVDNGQQTEPVVTWLNDQRFVVAWADANGVDGHLHSVRARVFNAVGDAMTAEIAVNATTLDSQNSPTITALPNAGFVIAWVDNSVTGGDSSASAIRLQAFDAGGGRIGGEFLVNTTTNFTQSLPSITALADGRVVVSWTDYSSGNADIRTQIIDPRDGIVTGTGAADTLYGHDAIGDEISGFNGADTLHGLNGNDQLYGGEGSDNLFGHAGDDTCYGGAGDDVLVGHAGNDALFGELGNDTYVLGAEATGVDIVSDTGGTDTITSAIDRGLAAFAAIENLTLVNVAAALSGTGNGLANIITGNSFNNTLNGQTGADTMIGLAGNDIYVVDNALDTVSEAGGSGTDTVQSSISFSLVNSARVLGALENLTLTGAAAINGTGNGLANLITGNGAANVLDGGADSLVDTLIGELGNDGYVLGASTNDVVSETTAGNGGGIDTATSTITRSLLVGGLVNVENLILLGGAMINGTGNGLVNVITGNSANNVLDGGALGDTMRGGAGNDTYVVDNALDTVDEQNNAGAGTADLVQSSVTFSLANSPRVLGALENLTLTGAAAINGTGNGLANVITGNGSANVLDGGDNNDTLSGLGGNDILIGGLGRDTMTGGTENDTFRFAATAQSAVGNPDIITDFDDSGDDLIDVSALFGPALTFRGPAPFSAAGQLRVATSGADVLVEVNVDANLAADFAIRLTNTTIGSVTASDFIL